jgi:hypothetical protein
MQIYADAYTNTYGNVYACCYRHGDCNSYLYSNSYGDSDVYADTNCNIYSHSDAIVHCAGTTANQC